MITISSALRERVKLADALRAEGILDRVQTLTQSTSLNLEEAARIVRDTTLTDDELQQAWRVSVRHGISMSASIRFYKLISPFLK